jgi:hypothetical protein
MVAVTRWVQYPLDAVGVAGDGRGAGGVGTAGYSIGTASVGDSFTIGPTTNRLHLSMDGDSGPYITLYSGSNLDPRFVARDITEKMHDLGKSDERWDNAVCKWENHSAYGNRFKIYSGTLGSASTVTVVSGTNTAHTVLGWSTSSEVGGTVNNSTGSPNTFSGDITISGTYYGFLDETYKIVITNDNDADRGIGTPVKSITYAGTMTTGGVYNYTADTTYTITINVTNGTTMGQGTGNVPTMTWTASPSADNSSASTELLYPDNWYRVGTRGLMVKFTDAVFGNGTWEIPCYKPDYTSGTNVTDAPGTAYFAYSSNRGDMGAAAVTPASGTYGVLGSRGLYITFNPTGPSDDLAIRDEFTVICSAPKPTSYNITSLNYGNVTVSTESDVKSVMFEIESGAAQMSTVKFGLQNHGSFSHHNAGNSDTYFRFGTVGPDNVAGTGAINAIEWYPDIAATDIDSDTPPSYLYATEDNLAVVSTADASEIVGNTGLISDPIWLNIRLGSSETGANSTINYRLYFDYS